MNSQIESYLKACAGIDMKLFTESLNKGDELAKSLDTVEGYGELSGLHEKDERFLLLIEVKKKWNPNYQPTAVK